MHIKYINSAFQEAMLWSKFNIEVTFQPTNSPYLHVLDLGLFNAIQSLQHQLGARTIEELVSTAMEDTFQQLNHSTLNNIFLTLQNCMEQITEETLYMVHPCCQLFLSNFVPYMEVYHI